MKIIFLLSLLCSFPAFAEIDMSPNPPQHRGNERSERVREAQMDPRQITYGGSGCPAGTVTVTMAPDNLSFSVFFDRFAMEVAPGQNGVDRKNCRILVPLQIPEGMQLGITRTDYRGFAELPARSRGELRSSTAFHGLMPDGRPSGQFSQPVDLRYNFVGPVAQEYAVSSGVLNARQYSPCGGFMRLMMDTNMMLHNQSRDQTAIVTLDTIDSAGELVYYVNWQRCSVGGRPGPGNPPPGGPPPRPVPGPRPPRR
jgi:hypothetical protein